MLIEFFFQATKRTIRDKTQPNLQHSNSLKPSMSATGFTLSRDLMDTVGRNVEYERRIADLERQLRIKTTECRKKSNLITTYRMYCQDIEGVDCALDGNKEILEKLEYALDERKNFKSALKDYDDLTPNGTHNSFAWIEDRLAKADVMEELIDEGNSCIHPYTGEIIKPKDITNLQKKIYELEDKIKELEKQID